MDAIRIEVISDTVCPWCFIGKRQLDAALSEMPDVDAHVRYVPFFLDPNVPEGGVDAAAYLAGKFGSARVFQRLEERIGETARELGIAFDFVAQKVRPHTLDSHRVIHWAERRGVQDAVVDALFVAYFEQGRDIGDRDTLAAVAERCGLNADEVRAKLETDDDVEEVRDQARAAIDRQVTGVPCFDIGGFLLPGAQSRDVYQTVIRRVISRRGESCPT